MQKEEFLEELNNLKEFAIREQSDSNNKWMERVVHKKFIDKIDNIIKRVNGN